MAFDPAAVERAKKVLPPSGRLSYARSVYEAAKFADAVLILTDWKEFAEIDLNKLREIVRFPIVIDGRNLFKPQDMLARGFTYISMGRESVFQVQHEKLVGARPVPVVSFPAERSRCVSVGLGRG